MISQWTADPTLLWFIIGLFCVIGEFALPGVIIVFFGAGAWVVSLVCYFIEINTVVQVLIFTVTSIAAFVTLRRRFNPSGEDGEPDVTDDFINKTAIVEETVAKRQPGRVMFKGSHWKAETFSDRVLEKGMYVRIIRKESIILFVEPLKGEEEKHV